MKIIFRADGNANTGLGHVMRSAALMQMLQSYFDCEFLTKKTEFFPFEDFNKEPRVIKFDFDNAEDEVRALINLTPKTSVIVLDGYQFDTEYQRSLKMAGKKVVCIDDLASCHFVADAVINHAGGVSHYNYSYESYTKLFLGAEYALVKPLFSSHKKLACDLRDKKLLISLGGADPHNDTEKILKTLSENSIFEEMHVVLGAANRFSDDLIDSYFSSQQIFFHRSLIAKDFCKLMLKCNYAILTPSTVCYEYMSVGGVVFLYQITDNQKRVREYFIREQLAFHFSDLNNINSDMMEMSLKNQNSLFDGYSNQRLIDIFIGIS